MIDPLEPHGPAWRYAFSRAVTEHILDQLQVIEAVRSDADGRAVVGWRYVEVDEAAAGMLGVPRERLVGRSVSEVLGDVGPQVEARCLRVLETGVAERYEATFRGRTFLVTLFPVDGDRVASAALEITERRRGEEAQARLAAIVESSDAAIVSKDPRGTLLTWNAAAEQLLGWRADEIVGRSVETIIPAQRSDEEREILRRVAGGERVEQLETERVAKDGRIVEVSVTVSPIRDGDGRITGASTILRDMGDRRRAEAALRAANEALEEASRRKDEFLGMLSHELRNPLAPIRNSLHVLQHVEPGGAQAQRAREVAIRQVTHLARLVDDLLDVTRIGRGKIELHREDVDLAAVATQVADDHRETLQARGLELVAAAPPTARVLVSADATRLAQVIGNLLSNAAKFTPAGGRVTVSVAEEAGRGVIRVRDTGAGITPGAMASLFQPFVQADGYANEPLVYNLVDPPVPQPAFLTLDFASNDRGTSINKVTWDLYSTFGEGNLRRTKILTKTGATAEFLLPQPAGPNTQYLVECAADIKNPDTGERTVKINRTSNDFANSAVVGWVGQNLAAHFRLKIESSFNPDTGLVVVSAYIERTGFTPP
jgi:PAS domain S-box-containing protein